MCSICQHFAEVKVKWLVAQSVKICAKLRHKVLESFLQQEQNLMTTDVSSRIMKRMHMRALNLVLKESRRERGELGVLIPLIIQLFIAKKLYCPTRLPATCTVLICLIGYLISSTRLLASTSHLTVLEVDQSLFLVLKFYLFYFIFMFSVSNIIT